MVCHWQCPEKMHSDTLNGLAAPFEGPQLKVASGMLYKEGLLMVRGSMFMLNGCGQPPTVSHIVII